MITTGVVIVIGLVGALYLSIEQRRAAPPAAVGTSPTEFFALLDDEFTPIEEMPRLTFPRDHAAHPSYRTEGWVFSGILTDPDARVLALNLTLLRLGLSDHAPNLGSRWTAAEAYAGMLAVSGPDAARLQVAERASRAALELAGTGLKPLQIWVEDWRLEGVAGGSEGFNLYGRVGTDDVSLNLRFSSQVPFIDGGALREREAGDTVPFAYYTQPQIDAVGTLRQNNGEVSVSGNFVMEHAWGELPLPGSPVVRDRFTLFLDDEREISLIRTHRRDGSGTPRTVGLLVGADGAPSVLSEQAIELVATDHWTSTRTGARYPTHWSLRVPDFDMELRLVPVRPDQEGVSGSPFWMGPVRLHGPSSAYSGIGTMFLDGYEGARQ